jgi:DNA-binding NarL/FixJ family response regulator
MGAANAGSPPLRSGQPELQPQEVALLRLVAGGLPIDTIARQTRTSERTVRRRIRDICDRLEVGTSIEAVVWAVRRGLV